MGEENRQKVEKKGELSEARVRGIACWCQFHSSSSMLRSFSLPERQNTPAGPQREAARERRDASNRNNSEASGGTRRDRKTEAE